MLVCLFDDSFDYEPLFLIHAKLQYCTSNSIGDDDNSNSLMSMSSDKEQTMSTMHGMGAQMVLERNLGAQPLDTEDEDTQDNFPPHHSSPQSSSRDRTKDEEADEEEEEEAEDEEESRRIHAQRRLSSGIHVSRTNALFIYVSK